MDVDHAAETILIIGIGDAPVEIGTTTVMVITTVVDMTGIETETLTGTTGDIEMETETAMEAGIAAVASCQHLQTKLLRRSIRPPLLFSVNCCLDLIMWSRLPELNRRPSNYESDALPTELSRLRLHLTIRIGSFECQATRFSSKVEASSASGLKMDRIYMISRIQKNKGSG